MIAAHETDPWRLYGPARRRLERHESGALGSLTPSSWWIEQEEEEADFALRPFTIAILYYGKGLTGPVSYPFLPADIDAVGDDPLPAELAYIREAIERSRPMLEWKDNWDREGSPAYSQATWNRTVDFIINNAAQLYRQLGVRVAAPVIKPGPDGSIDIDWRDERRALLINIPADAAEPASFFGRDNGRNAIEGTLDTTGRNQWLLMWLVA